MLTRRKLLAGSVAAAWAPALALLPAGVDAATLNATTRVTGYAVDAEGDIDGLQLQVTNDADHAINPVVLAWGVGRRTQQSWPLVKAPDSHPPGTTALYECRAPASGQDTPEEGAADRLELLPGKPAQVMLFDKGTEKRTITRFYPEVPE